MGYKKATILNLIMNDIWDTKKIVNINNIVTFKKNVIEEKKDGISSPLF